ncbi:MAG: hypothetical protein J6P98_00620 [Clostridia bacterium]|nr:hypothetical protein [Clostridia bacterium]
MKKSYNKPQMFMESFAITEHFAAGATGCETPVSSETACMNNYYFGPGMQGFFEHLGCDIDMSEWGCYNVPDGGEVGNVWS